MKEPSIFTKIINGEIPCHKIYEDDLTLAFLDNNPTTEGHTLVISKTQIDKVYDLPDDDYTALMLSVKRVAHMLESSLECERVGIAVQGHEVPHAHVHLLPLRQPGDFHAPRPAQPPTDEELMVIAERIRQV